MYHHHHMSPKECSVVHQVQGEGTQADATAQRPTPQWPLIPHSPTPRCTLTWPEEHGHPKVHNLDSAWVRVRQQQDVLRLHVAVQDAHGVAVAQQLHQRAHHPGSISLGVRLLPLNALPQLPPLTEVHHQVNVLQGEGNPEEKKPKQVSCQKVKEENRGHNMMADLQVLLFPLLSVYWSPVRPQKLPGAAPHADGAAAAPAPPPHGARPPSPPHTARGTAEGEEGVLEEGHGMSTLQCKGGKMYAGQKAPLLTCSLSLGMVLHA